MNGGGAGRMQEEKTTTPGVPVQELSEELIVHIPLSAIEFKEPYEQYKFEKLLQNNPESAIKQTQTILQELIDEFLKTGNLIISLH